MKQGLSPFLHFIIIGVVIYISSFFLRLTKLTYISRSTIYGIFVIFYMACFLREFGPISKYSHIALVI